MKILIDTHILIRCEVNRTIDRQLQDVIRHTTELKYWLMVHPRSILEVEKDKNIPDPDRDVLLSKIGRYPTLDSQSNPSDDKDFMAAIQKPKNRRDVVDNYLLYCLYKNEVDLFLTEDLNIVEKAGQLNISGRVMNLQEASSSFKKTLDEKKTRGGDVPTFCFYKKERRWFIGEKGNERDFEDLKGFGFIHFLLCNEYKDLPSSVVYHLGKVSGDEDPHGETSEREKADLGLHPEGPLYNKRLSEKDQRKIELDIESQIEKLQDEFDSADISDPEDKMVKEEELNEKIEKLKNHLKQQFNKKSDRDPSSQAEKARINVTRSIKKALSEIHKDKTMSSISKYLNAHTIKPGDTCVYRPYVNDKPAWNLFPDSKSK
jgi:hypothetical protein